jgi:hypothetical protein
MFYTLPHLENLHQQSISIFYFIFHPPPIGNANGITIGTRGDVSQISIFIKLIYQIVGGFFFLKLDEC